MEVLSLTNIFDNATGLTIGNKEVASIKIGEATIYEKEEPSRTVSFTVLSESETPLSGYTVQLAVGDSVGTTVTTNSDGVGTFNTVTDGTYRVGVSYLSGSSYSIKSFKVNGEGNWSQNNNVTVSKTATQWNLIVQS